MRYMNCMRYESNEMRGCLMDRSSRQQAAGSRQQAARSTQHAARSQRRSTPLAGSPAALPHDDAPHPPSFPPHRDRRHLPSATRLYFGQCRRLRARHVSPPSPLAPFFAPAALTAACARACACAQGHHSWPVLPGVLVHPGLCGVDKHAWPRQARHGDVHLLQQEYLEHSEVLRP
jgi:hypothetical protein